MSAPAANAFSLPVTTMAPMPSSASKSYIALASACISSGLRAFSCFGRLSVTSPTRPRRSTRITSELIRAHHPRVEAVQRREEGAVHLLRRDGLAAEALRLRRASVPDQRDLVAEVGS